MSNLNCSVTPGKVFTPDSSGKVQVTPDGLNLLGTPTVTANIDVSFLPTVTITTGAESANVRLITVQVLQADSTNQAAYFKMEAFLARSQYVLPGNADGLTNADTVPDGACSWTTGTGKAIITVSNTTGPQYGYKAKQAWHVMTNSAGQAVISVTNTTTIAAGSGWFLQVVFDGRLYTSSELTYS